MYLGLEAQGIFRSLAKPFDKGSGRSPAGGFGSGQDGSAGVGIGR